MSFDIRRHLMKWQPKQGERRCQRGGTFPVTVTQGSDIIITRSGRGLDTLTRIRSAGGRKPPRRYIKATRCENRRHSHFARRTGLLIEGILTTTLAEKHSPPPKGRQKRRKEPNEETCKSKSLQKNPPDCTRIEAGNAYRVMKQNIT